mgnify:CR=1 FL=1
MCPSIRAALADAAQNNSASSGMLIVSIDQSRVGRCGNTLIAESLDPIRVHRSEPRWPMRPDRVSRSARRRGVSIDQSRVGRCGRLARKTSMFASGVHRSEPRWPMRRTRRRLIVTTTPGVHRSEPRWPMRREDCRVWHGGVECPSIRAALADAAREPARPRTRPVSVHRSEPRWPMRRDSRVRGALLHLVSIDQSRVGRCGCVPCRCSLRVSVSIDQSRVGRCGTTREHVHALA